MSIVTKTGDKGETGLLSGERVSKTDKRVKAYGTLDELVSHIGWVLSLKPCAELAPLLKQIQIDLFRLGAELASIRLDPRWKVRPVGSEDTALLEKWVAEFEPRLELPKAFVLPGGTPCSAAIDIARTTARRLERKMVALKEKGLYESGEAIKYVNRLSDVLFIFARFEQKKGGLEYEPV